MRLPGLARAGLMAALLPAGLAAQGTFEGVITYQGGAGGGNGRTVWVKNGLMRVETVGGRAGSGTAIRDAQGRLLMLVESRHEYVVMTNGFVHRMPLPTFVATGRKETVAGYPCEYYATRYPGEKEGEGQACVTTSLGFMPMGPAGPIVPADERALHAQFHDGFVMLKVVDAAGRVISEATKVERTHVSEERFTLPAGYTEISLPGLVRPGPRSQ